MAKCESDHEFQRVVFFLTFHFMLPSLDCSKTAFQKFPLFFITSKVREFTFQSISVMPDYCRSATLS